MSITHGGRKPWRADSEIHEGWGQMFARSAWASLGRVPQPLPHHGGLEQL